MGANPNHYVYISGGTGADEAVLITGGTCTSGGASGTIDFAAANAHSGAWQIGSATAGIQEAIFSLPDTGGTIFIPAGIHNIFQTISIGDGTSTTSSTKNSVQLFGTGSGATDVETLTTGASYIKWNDPNGGSMFAVHGPIAGLYLHDFFLDGNGQAQIGLDVTHAFNSAFRNIMITKIEVYGVSLDTHASGPFSVGASDNIWENIQVKSISPGAGGFRLTAVQISWAEQRRLLQTREKASPKGCSGDQVAALDKIEIMLLSQLGLHSRQ